MNFSTKASTRLERSRQWGILTRADQVEIDDDRESSLRGIDLGEVRLAMVSMGRHRIAQSGVAGSAAGGPSIPVIKFIFQEEGTARIRQRAGTIELSAGQWCCVRKDEAFLIEAPGPSRQLAMSLPSRRLSDPGTAYGSWNCAHSFRRGAGHILHAAASASIVSGAGLDDAAGAQLGASLVQLLELALRSGDLVDMADLRSERRQTALDFIERHLADPELDVPAIAAALGCSARTIHKLFEGEALTVAREIWDRRLERCRLELVDPALARRSITEIAHHWGFSDSQHFSRAFKHRFGATPREYRSLSLLN